MKLIQQRLLLIKPFCGPAVPKGTSDPAFLRMSFAKEIFYPTDKMFDDYMKQLDFKMAASDAKITMKKRNSIIAEWPCRFEKRYGEAGAEEAFDRQLADLVTSAEHYVEWRL